MLLFYTHFSGKKKKGDETIGDEEKDLKNKNERARRFQLY